MKKRIICIVLSLSVFVCMAAVKGTFAWLVTEKDFKSHMLEIGQLKLDIVGNLGSNYRDSSNRALVVPGENLIVVPVEQEPSTNEKGETLSQTPTIRYEHSPLILNNFSTIDSQIRLKITYDYYDTASQANASSMVYAAGANEKLEVIFPTSLKCEYNAVDKYWYCSDSGKDVIVAATENLSSSGVTQASTSSVSTTVATTSTSASGTTSGTSTTQPSTLPPKYNKVVLIESLNYKGNKYDKTFEGKIFNVKIEIQAKQAYYVDWANVAELNL